MKCSKCPACNAEVSLFAKRCPNCGARVLHPIFGILVAAICIVIVFVVMNPNKATPADAQGQIPPSPSVDPDQSNTNSSEITLGPGTYTVGKDIDAGTYDCIAVSGLGVLRGDIAAFGDPGFVLTMGCVSASIGGETASVEAAPSYSNLTLTDGDVFYVEMNLNVEFVPK